MVTGAPRTRKQYSLDPLISDWVIAQGYAFASIDKGNSGPDFYTDGKRPGDAIAEWNRRTTELTLATKTVVRQAYGHGPRRTYMTGISNGGYLTRWQLENHPELYDGGVDWEGALWTEDGPNLFTYLPTAVAYQAGRATHADMLTAGFAPGTEFLWPYHEAAYWGLTQRCTARRSTLPTTRGVRVSRRLDASRRSSRPARRCSSTTMRRGRAPCTGRSTGSRSPAGSANP